SLRGQLALADAHRARVDERGLTRDELVARVGQQLDPALLRAADRVLPRADAREVDVGGAAPDAPPVAQLGGRVRALGRDEVRLCRPARDVGAASAPARPFDERDARAVLARCLAGGVARTRAGADDDEIESVSHGLMVSNGVDSVTLGP